MVSVKDVPADAIIGRMATKLKSDDRIKPPEWAKYAKTGPQAQRKPEQKDWWYVRCASILRKTYVDGVIGVGRLSTWYGGRQNPGTSAEHHVDASTNVIRKCCQQLETAGLLKKEKAGRSLAPAGRKFVDGCVKELEGEGIGRPRRVEAAPAVAAAAEAKPRAGPKRAVRATKVEPAAKSAGAGGKRKAVKAEAGES
jgi:small subunit ribosomal protein S19e